MNNPHIKNADNLMTVSGSVSPGGKPEARLLVAAQIEATLAVAYEQRTANLIAAREFVDIPGSEIAERLDRPAPEPVRPAPVQHYRTGPGRCNCGFDAYKINAIMVDYSEELAHHLRSNR